MGTYYGFIDCEFTSGYAPRLQSVELIALGCIIIDQTGSEVARYEQLVRPTKKSNQKLTRRIRELTKLTQAQIDEAPPFAVFARDFEAELQRYEQAFGHEITWWSWGDYDHVALKQTLSVNHYEGPLTHFVECIQDLQPQVIPQLFAKLGIKKQQLSLANSKLIFGLGTTIQHQALADAIDLKDVFWAFRHQEPDWELVETFRPRMATPQPPAAPPTPPRVHVFAASVPNATVYGLFKQLWQLQPPLAPTLIEWQHRRCVLANREAILIRDLQMAWMIQNERHVYVTVFTATQQIICSHLFQQTKQNQKLVQTLINELHNQPREHEETANKQGDF